MTTDKSAIRALDRALRHTFRTDDSEDDAYRLAAQLADQGFTLTPTSHARASSAEAASRILAILDEALKRPGCVVHARRTSMRAKVAFTLERQDEGQLGTFYRVSYGASLQDACAQAAQILALEEDEGNDDNEEIQSD